MEYQKWPWFVRHSPCTGRSQNSSEQMPQFTSEQFLVLFFLTFRSREPQWWSRPGRSCKAVFRGQSKTRSAYPRVLDPSIRCQLSDAAFCHVIVLVQLLVVWSPKRYFAWLMISHAPFMSRELSRCQMHCILTCLLGLVISRASFMSREHFFCLTWLFRAHLLVGSRDITRVFMSREHFCCLMWLFRAHLLVGSPRGPSPRPPGRRYQTVHGFLFLAGSRNNTCLARPSSC